MWGYYCLQFTDGETEAQRAFMHLAHGLSMQGMSRSCELGSVAPKSWLSLLKKKYIFLFIYLIWLCWVLAATCGLSFPDQGLNPGLLDRYCGILNTGLPEKDSPRTLALHPRVFCPCHYGKLVDTWMEVLNQFFQETGYLLEMQVLIPRV